MTINKLNNKYLLSAFLCLLSATAAKANPNSHHVNAIATNANLNQHDDASRQLKKHNVGEQQSLSYFKNSHRLLPWKEGEPILSISQLPEFAPRSASTWAIAQTRPSFEGLTKETGDFQTISTLNIATPDQDTAITTPLMDSTIRADKYLVAQSLENDNQKLFGQVNSVRQLQDVSPNDWAYEALRSLSERYGCIGGFEDGTFRGQETLTRNQFAAGLNSCLQQIESLIASQSQATVKAEDLQVAQKLTQEFETELAGLSKELDSLETRVATLENNQFSTTTIFNGEVVLALADAWGGGSPGGCESLNLNLQNGETANAVNCGVRQGEDATSTADEPDSEPLFAYFARLGLQTSFTGKDRLRMYLTSGNFDNGGYTSPEAFNTYSPRFSYQAGLENQVVLDILEYRFPVLNDRVVLYAAGYGFSLSNVLTANSPFFDIGRGSVSRFGQFNPIFRIGGAMDAGVGADWLISDRIRLQTAYGTRDSSEANAGFFGSDFSALGVQLLLQPTDNIVTGLTYVNAYSNDGSLGTFTGSVNAETNGLWSSSRLPQVEDGLGGAFPGIGVELGDFPAQINAVGGTFQWNLTSKLNLGASTAYTFTNYLNEIPEFNLDGQIPGTTSVAGEEPFANTLTYQISLGISDPLGREGDLLGFVFGMPPKLVNAGPVTPGQTVPFSEQVINNEDPVAITDNDPRQFLTNNENFGDPDNDFLVQEGTIDQLGKEDEATSLHYEVFYRFTVSDRISVTPGIFVVTNPGHIADNDTIYVGTIRTTFRF
ncbi:MAG: iron uptake porin [Cyanobacteria bacterium J06600_6]